MSVSAPSWILVDIGGVLVHVHTTRMVAALAARAGCAAEAAERALFAGGGKRDLDVGRIDFDEYCARVRAAVSPDACDSVWFRAAWSGLFDERADAPALVAALRVSGAQLALASNTDPVHWEALQAFPSVRSIDRAVLSFELHALKPEAAFYEGALQRLGIAAPAALLLDDRAENVEGARAAGLRAAQYPLDDATSWIRNTLPGLLGACRA